MDKQDLIKEYLKTSKFSQSPEKRLEIYEKLKEQSKGNPDLESFFEGLILAIKKKYEEAIEAYKRAMEIAENSAYPWNGIGNLYAEQKNYREAIEAYKRAIEIDENFANPWNGLGDIYKNQKKYEEAIEAYKKATEIDENYANPWNGLGILYREQKNYREAIEAYKKATEIDENYANPWNGLGNLYREQKKNEEAIEAYKRAIELDKNFAYPWNGFGNLYLEQKKYGEAIEAYKRSMEIDQDLIVPILNIGLLYFYNLGKLDLAKDYFEKAKIKCENDNDSYMLSKCVNNLEKVNKEIERKKVLDQMKDKVNDLKNSLKDKSKNDKLYQIISRTLNMKKSINNKQKEFKDFIISPKMLSDDSNYVEILRRWNSYTPIIANNYHISKGGGYFLNINNKGIVIDPGFNFIDNFKGAGHVFNEIDTVIISHAHNDHTADLESILTLLFKYNDGLKGIDDEESDWTIRAEIAKEKNIDIKTVLKEDILKAFKDSDRKKILNFICH